MFLWIWNESVYFSYLQPFSQAPGLLRCHCSVGIRIQKESEISWSRYIFKPPPFSAQNLDRCVLLAVIVVTGRGGDGLHGSGRATGWRWMEDEVGEAAREEPPEWLAGRERH